MKKSNAPAGSGQMSGNWQDDQMAERMPHAGQMFLVKSKITQ